MSIKLELDADSIKQAISDHIAKQGFDLANKSVDVALINGRGGNGNRATVTISDEGPKVPSNQAPYPDELSKKPIAHTAAEIVAEDVKAIAEEITEAPIEIEAEEVITPEIDPILAAAESSTDPFGDESDIFPKVNPSDVKTPTSLF